MEKNKFAFSVKDVLMFLYEKAVLLLLAACGVLISCQTMYYAEMLDGAAWEFLESALPWVCRVSFVFGICSYIAGLVMLVRMPPNDTYIELSHGGKTEKIRAPWDEMAEPYYTVNGFIRKGWGIMLFAATNVSYKITMPCASPQAYLQTYFFPFLVLLSIAVAAYMLPVLISEAKFGSCVQV